MPEGPEVRKYADALHDVLSRRQITLLEARTREAREWLKDNESRLIGRRVERVVSHGKHLIGYIHDNFYFHSHLMMWGRWETFTLKSPKKKQKHGWDERGRDTRTRQHGRDARATQYGRDARATQSERDARATQDPRDAPATLPEKDRRERARIVVDGGGAILMSAPIFNVGEGDPYRQIENLKTLGPDVLPYRGKFDATEFQRRLFLREHRDAPIGAALLNQQIVAGLGNYLRAEVLFACKLNPWRKVKELTADDIARLTRNIPILANRAYKRGATAIERDRKRMAGDATLVYQPGRDYGTRHLVFRRTNLPCLRCGDAIKQLRQETHNPQREPDVESRTRIVYFCAKCQRV